MNQALVVGNLGADPEIRYTNNGVGVVSLRVATNEKWKDKQGERHERVEWHTVVVWGAQADTCNQWLSKGDQVLVQGRMQTREWADKNGVVQKTTEIVAETVKFLNTKRRQNRPPPPDERHAPTSRREEAQF